MTRGRSNKQATARSIVAGLLALTLLCGPVHASERTPASFATALEAARAHQWEELDWLQSRLEPDHPLQGYLDFHRLLARLPDVPVADVRRYMTGYEQLPVAGDLRDLALARYGEAGHWEKIRALQKHAPRDTALQCLWHRAWLDLKPERSVDAGQRLWLSGASRPAACDALFEALMERGRLDDELVWQRIQLAFRADNPGLMNYLATQLKQRYQGASDRLQRIYRQPEEALATIGQGYSEADPSLMAELALHRLADVSPVAALQWLRSSRARELGLDDERTRADIEGRIAWFMTIRGESSYRQWLDHWLLHHAGAGLLEQRARLAVREQDWDALPGWIARLPVSDQQQAQWQYWLARAWQERGEQSLAEDALRAAAGQRSFFGFAAASLLGRDYPLNLQVPAVPGPAQTRDLEAEPAMERVQLLREAGEYGLARREWFQALHAGDASREARAGFAMRRGWYDLAVGSALHERTWDILAWRFPAAFRDSFFRIAGEQRLDPWLAMAVARRESGFNPQARSHAGAMGLMQVMPATARKVADRLPLDISGNGELLDPEISIRLGTAFLAELLERYRGNRIKALAAYNAGPHRVDRWLPEEPVPYDVWIESIPFHETRDYVQAVLTYRLILARLHGDADNGDVAMLLEHERGAVGGPDSGTLDLSRR